ncbi:MAG: KamA family radical SAM protein [Saccharofermentanales bacterium]
MNYAAEKVRKIRDKRFEGLKQEIADYESVKSGIRTGLDSADRIYRQKQKILQFLGASQEQWDDYKWQLKYRFTDADEIGKILGLPAEEVSQIAEIGKTYRYAISPYYLSLIDPEDPACPVKLQSVPSFHEAEGEGMLDPMDEDGWTPEEMVTRRYPDRLIIKVTNQCGMYCRFCQRRRRIGERDTHSSFAKLMKAVDYVRQNPEIRDVLITGGDAFLLSDDVLDRLLAEIRGIGHVEIIRLGTRTPVTLPQRVTPALAAILKKYHPLYVNTHFNSPAEITAESRKACEMLADAGIPLGNQMVLLSHINNDKFIVRKLNQELLKIRVKPYYIFHPKTVKGTSHFWVKVEDGLEIIESLRGRTSGMAVPAYIVNGSGGLGKTPIMPNYLLYIGKDNARFRNWRGEIFTIKNNF